MSDAVRTWLVDREYTDKGLITLEYATTDGERSFVKQISLHAPDPTAAKDVDPADLDAVADADTREQFRTEAQRMQAKHDPDDQV